MMLMKTIECKYKIDICLWRAAKVDIFTGELGEQWNFFRPDILATETKVTSSV